MSVKKSDGPVKGKEAVKYTKEIFPGVKLKEPEDPRVDHELWCFGQTLKKRREQLGWTIRFTAQSAGINVPALVALERGASWDNPYRRVISAERLHKLLEILGLPRRLADKAEFIWALHGMKPVLREEYLQLITEVSDLRKQLQEVRTADNANKIQVMWYNSQTGNLQITGETLSVPGLSGKICRAFKIETTDGETPTMVSAGSHVIFDFEQQLKTGDLGLFLEDDEVVVRRFDGGPEDSVEPDGEREFLGRLIYIVAAIN